MSTMDRAASAPEASSAPARACPAPAAPAGVPVTRLSPSLRGFVEQNDVERARVDPAVVADVHGPPAAAQHGVALGGHQQALGRDGELAVAGVAHALGGAHAEEALAGDGEVQRLAGVAARLRGEVGLDRRPPGPPSTGGRPPRRSRGSRAAARRTRAGRSGRPCSRASPRWPGRWRSGPGGSARRASRRRRCRGHGPSWPGYRPARRDLRVRDPARRMIDRVALDALLLRAQLPELTLREGASVVARVAARAEAHGVIVLAGVPLTAQLPPEVREGETLHLRVQEVTEERVTLKLDPQPRRRPARRRRRAAAGPPRRRRPAPPPAGRRRGVRRRSRSPSTPRCSGASTCASTSRAAACRRGGGARGRGLDARHRRPPACRTPWRADRPRRAAVRVSARREPFDAYA